MGKSNLYSKTNISTLTTPSPTLQALPNPPIGLEAFSPFLAEDNMIALSLMHQLHLTHAMTPDVALDFLGPLTLMDYINRRIRWLRVRKKMTPLAAVLIEPFTESIICGIYGSWALGRLFGVTAKAIWVVHMVLWLIVDLGVRDALGSNVGEIGVGGSGLGFVGAWVVREVLALPVWVWGMGSDEVVWRGKRYRIMKSGEFVWGGLGCAEVVIRRSNTA
jgi:ceramide glucosyltransferase